MELKYNKNLLYDLYINKELSLSKIASMYNVTSMTIRKWLHNNSINTRPSTRVIYNDIRKIDFTDLQKSLLVGSILGDGSVIINKDCKNAHFIERHGERQKQYLLWKKESLNPFTKSKVSFTEAGNHEISGVKCYVSRSYMFSTITHSYLTELRHIFYNGKKKIIPRNLYSMLNYLTVAIWLCDDGCFTYSTKFGVYRLDLHTESFTKEENIYLCNILSKFFNKSFRINSRIYKSGKSYYICLSGKNNLFDIVSILKPFIPDCMIYKFKDYII